jgi:hypothetical protein
MTIPNLFLILAVVSAAAGAQTAKVKQWDRFEAAVTNTKPYANPYKDVELIVTYTKPNGDKVDFWGFHDGGQTWRIRFMPDVKGKWTYEARFTDNHPGAKGSFEVTQSDLPGMISQYEANPIWFGYRNGKRALIRSFHVGDRFFARNWDAASRKAFLDWFENQGYNTISIASHYLNRTVEKRGKDWNTPDLYPLNAAEFQSLESMLDELNRRRILVFPFAGFFGKESDFPREPGEQERYVRYTLARLGPYWNHFLLVGGPEPLLKKNPHLTFEEVNRLGGLIQRLDPFGHLLSVHNATGVEPFKDQAWTSYGVVQGPKTLDPAVLSKGLLAMHHPSKPLFAQETLWPGNTFGHPKYTLTHVRKNAYVVLFSAAALNYADMAGSSSSGFTGSMDMSEKIQERHDLIRRIWNYFDTLPFERMKPRQDLVDNGYCLAEAGREYLVYLDKPGAVKIKLDSSARYTAQWINAQNTSESRPARPTSPGTYETPPGGDDWLLRLRRK